jgi:hypothetical protein
MAAQTKAWFYGHSLAETVGLNPTEGMDVCLFVSTVCCKVEVSVRDRSLIQSSPTECGVSKAGITRGYCTCYLPASSVAS